MADFEESAEEPFGSTGFAWPGLGKRKRATEIVVQVTTNQADVGECSDFICVANEDYTLLQVAGEQLKCQGGNILVKVVFPLNMARFI